MFFQKNEDIFDDFAPVWGATAATSNDGVISDMHIIDT